MLPKAIAIISVKYRDATTSAVRTPAYMKKRFFRSRSTDGFTIGKRNNGNKEVTAKGIASEIQSTERISTM
jgi:hypothetical protein